MRKHHVAGSISWGQHIEAAIVIGGFDCRDMSVEDACELGKRAIYHATFRDAVSGGTVSGAS